MKEIKIGGRKIGRGSPVFVIAEISANHNHSLDEALKLIEISKESGADAVKIQTYTPDTMTIDCRNDHFVVGQGTIWTGRNLHDLYREAYTPWEWTSRLMERANELNLGFLSTAFDRSSVDFLEDLNLPAYKIASFELVDIPLLRRVASTGKPVILSTGMASLPEICEAVETLRENGCSELVLLKCTSSYPAPPEEANLARIRHMSECFDVPVGLSDHTMGSTVPAIAVALGACVIEKHLTQSRKVPGPDSVFSLEPPEFAEMVEQVRIAEKAVGRVTYALTDHEKASRAFRRSIFLVRDVAAGEPFTIDNIRIIRPGYGLPPKELDRVLGRKAKSPIHRGTPLAWDLVD